MYQFSKQSTEELENCVGQRTLILGITSDHLCLYHWVNIVSLQLLLLLDYDAVDRLLISLLVKYIIKYLSPLSPISVVTLIIDTQHMTLQ